MPDTAHSWCHKIFPISPIATFSLLQISFLQIKSHSPLKSPPEELDSHSALCSSFIFTTTTAHKTMYYCLFIFSQLSSNLTPSFHLCLTTVYSQESRQRFHPHSLYTVLHSSLLYFIFFYSNYHLLIYFVIYLFTMLIAYSLFPLARMKVPRGSIFVFFHQLIYFKCPE